MLVRILRPFASLLSLKRLLVLRKTLHLAAQRLPNRFSMTRAQRICIVTLALIATSGGVRAQGIASQSGFGTKVEIADTDVLIAEPMNERIGGMLYVFSKDVEGEWVQTQVLSADDGHPGDRFGVSIDVDNDRMVVSATRSNEARGAVYLFERDANGSWTQQGKI